MQVAGQEGVEVLMEKVTAEQRNEIEEKVQIS